MTLMLRGRPVAEEIQKDVADRVTHYRGRGVIPKIVTLLTEGDPASSHYAKMKQRRADKLGIQFELLEFPHSVGESELIQVVQTLNDDVSVHGVMVELPLPEPVSSERVIERISPLKDVDGLTRPNRYANVFGDPGIYPATPIACVRLLKHYGYDLSGKHVTLVGCGKTVGMPLFHLLIRENATVTVCHAGTRDLSLHMCQAEVGFVAAGSAGLITPQMVHPNLILVDAGINETPDGKIVGDVAPEVAQCIEALSPTPGGVGPVTTMQLFANLMRAIDMQTN